MDRDKLLLELIRTLQEFHRVHLLPPAADGYADRIMDDIDKYVNYVIGDDEPEPAGEAEINALETNSPEFREAMCNNIRNILRKEQRERA